MDIPEKCDKCIHRLRGYCRGYQCNIEVLDVEKCTIRKTEKRRDRLKKKFGARKK